MTGHVIRSIEPWPLGTHKLRYCRRCSHWTVPLPDGERCRYGHPLTGLWNLYTDAKDRGVA